MARILGVSPQNELKIQDNLSNSVLTVFYRLPTTAERLHYSTKCIRREGAKVTFNYGPTRQEYAAKVITGFKDGDFADGDGNPMASDPASPRYNKGWRELIAKYAADILEVLALHVFEGSASVKRDEEGAIESTEEVEEVEEPTPAVDDPTVKAPAPDDASGN